MLAPPLTHSAYEGGAEIENKKMWCWETRHCASIAPLKLQTEQWCYLTGHGVWLCTVSILWSSWWVGRCSSQRWSSGGQTGPCCHRGVLRLYRRAIRDWANSDWDVYIGIEGTLHSYFKLLKDARNVLCIREYKHSNTIQKTLDLTFTVNPHFTWAGKFEWSIEIDMSVLNIADEISDFPSKFP